MASKVIRVSEEALAAASVYADDLSTAILIMNAKIEELRAGEKQAETLKEIQSLIAGIRNDIPDEKTLKKIITGNINDCFADLNRGF